MSTKQQYTIFPNYKHLPKTKDKDLLLIIKKFNHYKNNLNSSTPVSINLIISSYFQSLYIQRLLFLNLDLLKWSNKIYNNKNNNNKPQINYQISRKIQINNYGFKIRILINTILNNQSLYKINIYPQTAQLQYENTAKIQFLPFFDNKINYNTTTLTIDLQINNGKNNCNACNHGSRLILKISYSNNTKIFAMGIKTINLQQHSKIFTSDCALFIESWQGNIQLHPTIITRQCF